MNRNNRKQALGYFTDCIDDADEKKNIREILANQNIDTVLKLMLLKDADIESMTQEREAGKDSEGKPVRIHVDIPKSYVGTIKQLRDFSHYLSNESSLTDIVDVKLDVLFEEFQFASITKPKPTPTPTPTAPTISTAPSIDISRQITAIDKYDVKAIPHWNGSNGDYPRIMRNTKQVLKNYGMSAVVDISTTPVPNDGSLAW